MNTNKPDFSDVRGGSSSVPADTQAQTRPGFGQADFSDVRSGSSSTPDITPSSHVRSYTVEKGDTLSAIAKRVYGRSSQWSAIYQANRDQLDDPDRIYPGQVLKLPDVSSN